MSGGWKVQLAIYDISMGMASQLSMSFLGEQIEAIYHTGIIVYGKEFFFGGGIQQCPHEQFVASHGGIRPIQLMDLGTTDVPEEVFQDFLREISPRFTMATYDLIKNNCNNFTDACADFLLGQGIPQHIVGLPERVFSTPMGQMIRPMIENMQNSINNPEQRVEALQTMGAALFSGMALPQVSGPPNSDEDPKDLSEIQTNVSGDSQESNDSATVLTVPPALTTLGKHEGPQSSCAEQSSRKRHDSGIAKVHLEDIVFETGSSAAAEQLDSKSLNVSNEHSSIPETSFPKILQSDVDAKAPSEKAPSSSLQSVCSNKAHEEPSDVNFEATQLMGSFLQSLRGGQLGLEAVGSAQGLISLLANQENTQDVLASMKQNLPSNNDN